MTAVLPEPVITLDPSVRETLQRARDNLLNWGWTTYSHIGPESGRVCAVGAIVTTSPWVIREQHYSLALDYRKWVLRNLYGEVGLGNPSVNAAVDVLIRVGHIPLECHCGKADSIARHSLEKWNDTATEEAVIALFDKALSL